MEGEIQKIKKITKDNLSDLEIFADFLRIAIEQEGFEIEIPELLSINKFGKKYVKNKNNESIAVVGEITKTTYKKMDEDTSVIFPLILIKK